MCNNNVRCVHNNGYIDDNTKMVRNSSDGEEKKMCVCDYINKITEYMCMCDKDELYLQNYCNKREQK